MISLNSDARYKEGFQGEEEALAGDQRKGDQKGNPTPGVDASGVLDATDRRRHDGTVSRAHSFCSTCFRPTDFRPIHFVQSY